MSNAIILYCCCLLVQLMPCNTLRLCALYSFTCLSLCYRYYSQRSWLRAISLVPRPYPQEGKGSGELGLNPWACAVDFPCANQIAGLAQSYDSPTAGMQSAIASCINLNCRPARGHAHDQSDPRFVSVPQCQRAHTEPVKPRKWSKFTRPLFPP